MRRSVITEIIAAAIIILLVYASLSKLLAYPVFAAQLHTHPLLKHFAGFLAWALPAVELAIAALLVIPRTRLTGFTGALALLAVFTLYIAGMLLLDSHLPCSCGGVLKSLSWQQHLLFNIFFTVLAFVGRLLEKRAHLTRWNMVHSSPP